MLADFNMDMLLAAAEMFESFKTFEVKRKLKASLIGFLV